MKKERELFQRGKLSRTRIKFFQNQFKFHQVKTVISISYSTQNIANSKEIINLIGTACWVGKTNNVKTLNKIIQY